MCTGGRRERNLKKSAGMQIFLFLGQCTYIYCILYCIYWSATLTFVTIDMNIFLLRKSRSLTTKHWRYFPRTANDAKLCIGQVLREKMTCHEPSVAVTVFLKWSYCTHTDVRLRSESVAHTKMARTFEQNATNHQNTFYIKNKMINVKTICSQLT